MKEWNGWILICSFPSSSFLLLYFLFQIQCAIIKKWRNTKIVSNTFSKPHFVTQSVRSSESAALLKNVQYMAKRVTPQTEMLTFRLPTLNVQILYTTYCLQTMSNCSKVDESFQTVYTTYCLQTTSNCSKVDESFNSYINRKCHLDADKYPRNQYTNRNKCNRKERKKDKKIRKEEAVNRAWWTSSQVERDDGIFKSKWHP